MPLDMGGGPPVGAKLLGPPIYTGMAPRRTTQPRTQRGTPKGGEWETSRRAEQVASSPLGMAGSFSQIRVTVGPDLPTMLVDGHGREVLIAPNDLYVADTPLPPSTTIGFLPDGRSIQHCPESVSGATLESLGAGRRDGWVARFIPVSSGGMCPRYLPIEAVGRPPDGGTYDQVSSAIPGSVPPEFPEVEALRHTLSRGEGIVGIQARQLEECGEVLAGSPGSEGVGRRLALFAKMVRASSLVALPDSGVSKAEVRAVRSRFAPDGSLVDSARRPGGPPDKFKIGPRTWSVLTNSSGAIYAAHGAKVVAIRKAPDVDYGALWELAGAMSD